MNAAEFATEHAGTRYIIPAEELPANLGYSCSIEFAVYGQVVGYLKHNDVANDVAVVIELEEKSFRQYCWPLYDGVVLTIDRNDMYDSNQPMVMGIGYKFLKRRSRWEIGEKQEERQIVLSKPYPSRCKCCGLPARKLGKLIMCSNRACNTRSTVLKALDVKYHKVNILRCPAMVRNLLGERKVCGRRAVSASKRLDGDSYKIACENGHVFYRYIQELQVNDVIKSTLDGDNSDRIWNGKKWVTY